MKVIGDHLKKLAGSDDPERSIDEFAYLSGGGDSHGWRFDRNEIQRLASTEKTLNGIDLSLSPI
jgi:hypothetical protein